MTFSGTDDFNVEYKQNDVDGRYCFRKFDNGDYRNKTIFTKHPNIVYSVIKGKKSWGLWVQEWSEGIVDCTFTIDEIENEFIKNDIIIPKPLWKDFLNVIDKKKQIRNLKYFEEFNLIYNKKK